ncbi:hypothetical protein ASG36_18710 [Geodermatophilus sp. Leaf369]|uniref:hypothetical protein n=1 Tax=Geodermatophilus sp. Leaf369 TaxID=1736354 RepID=UPI0006FA79A6|nr:hypothetical protein [Geodermatophilus sp. Leaf369]KQS57019.1 hypothetical protein ASG36_18710 [Geodermatophilus sp. Leaf369]
MATELTPEVRDWLLDGDPAIRWQVHRDLLRSPADVVDAERARVATEGWGARLLALQGDDGQWAGGAYFPDDATAATEPGQPWTSTAHVLELLRRFGLPPEAAREALAGVAENCRWEHDGQRFFDGEVEPCINGMTLAVGAYFDQDVAGIAARLVAEQLADGGWNCAVETGSTRSSFHTTIAVLEGLLEFERRTGDAGAREARLRGQDYLLQRRLLRKASTGELIDPDFTTLAFPPRWYFDVLRALDHLRDAGTFLDEHCREAVEAVAAQQGDDGRWLVGHAHPGRVPFELEPVGAPSRWNTLRALRVLAWWEGR